MLWQYLLSPLAIGLVLALLAWRGRAWPAWLRGALAVGTGLCLLLATEIGAEPLLRAVESAAGNRCAAPAPQAVVVLGGGVRADAAAGEVDALSAASLRRVIGAAALWHRLPATTPFVVSGGNVHGGPAEATLMAELATRLGVPPAVQRIDAESRTTWQNAQHLAALAPPVPRRVWLVTSAAHLPRASWTFRHFGFAPCGVGVDERATRRGSWLALLPSATAIQHADIALHELVGMAWYRLRAAFAPADVSP